MLKPVMTMKIIKKANAKINLSLDLTGVLPNGYHSIHTVMQSVTLHDTVPDLAPVPKDSARIKYVTRWLPSVPDTVTQWKAIPDSVAVEVPITSKHYGSKDYDAWVSGFEPSLDSIKVYKETQYITTTITQSKPPNKLTLDVSAGADYFTERNELYPYIKGNLQYNINERWSVGAQGGMYKADETQPFAGGYVKIKVF